MAWNLLFHFHSLVLSCCTILFHSPPNSHIVLCHEWKALLTSLRTLFTPSASLSLSPMNPSSSDSSKQSDILHSHGSCNTSGTQILGPPPIMWMTIQSCSCIENHASELSRSGICDRCIHYGKEWLWWSRVRFSISSHIGLLRPHNILWRCGPILTVTDQTHLLTLNNSQYQLEVEFNGNNHN